MRPGGASVGEGEAGFATFGRVKEAAIWVGLDPECKDEVADRCALRVSAVFDMAAHVFRGDKLHRIEADDAVDFFLDAGFPSSAVELAEVMHGGGVAGAGG